MNSQEMILCLEQQTWDLFCEVKTIGESEWTQPGTWGARDSVYYTEGRIQWWAVANGAVVDVDDILFAMPWEAYRSIAHVRCRSPGCPLDLEPGRSRTFGTSTSANASLPQLEASTRTGMFTSTESNRAKRRRNASETDSFSQHKRRVFASNSTGGKAPKSVVASSEKVSTNRETNDHTNDNNSDDLDQINGDN